MQGISFKFNVNVLTMTNREKRTGILRDMCDCSIKQGEHKIRENNFEKGIDKKREWWYNIQVASERRRNMSQMSRKNEKFFKKISKTS